MHVGLKGKVYRIVVRSTVGYGFDYRSIKKTQVQKLMIAEMRMIR